MTREDSLYAQTDAYIGPGVPLFFVGRFGVRLVGYTEIENLGCARTVLDGLLTAQGLNAAYLSSFETSGGALGYVAHS